MISNATTVRMVDRMKINPPIVGVPSFCLWLSPTKMLILCPICILFKHGIKITPSMLAHKKPIITANTALVNSNMKPLHFYL